MAGAVGLKETLVGRGDLRHCGELFVESDQVRRAYVDLDDRNVMRWGDFCVWKRLVWGLCSRLVLENTFLSTTRTGGVLMQWRCSLQNLDKGIG